MSHVDDTRVGTVSEVNWNRGFLRLCLGASVLWLIASFLVLRPDKSMQSAYDYEAMGVKWKGHATGVDYAGASQANWSNFWDAVWIIGTMPIVLLLIWVSVEILFMIGKWVRRGFQPTPPA